VLSSENKIHDDITHFDYPFLLGDWLLHNATMDESHQDYRSINLTLLSDYSFLVRIQKPDNTFEFWDGYYEVNGDRLVLGSTSLKPQYYFFVNTHNRLILNGISFFKMLSEPISGAWRSESLSGTDVYTVGINKIVLILQPDFVFYFKASNGVGKEVIHNGIYYVEDDHLVLVYEDGEFNSTFRIKNNTMRLRSDDGSMTALLTKMQ